MKMNFSISHFLEIYRDGSTKESYTVANEETVFEDLLLEDIIALRDFLNDYLKKEE